MLDSGTQLHENKGSAVGVEYLEKKTKKKTKTRAHYPEVTVL